MRRRLSSRVMGQILEEPRFLGGDRRPAHSRPTTLHNNVLQILHTSIEDILSSNVRAQFSPSQRLEGGGGGGDLANSFQRGSLDHVIDRAPPKEGCPLRWRNQARRSEVWISSMLAGKMCKATLRQPRRRRRRRRRKTRRKEARGLRQPVAPAAQRPNRRQPPQRRQPPLRRRVRCWRGRAGCTKHQLGRRTLRPGERGSPQTRGALGRLRDPGG